MLDEQKPRRDSRETAVYQIRVKGHLGAEWADWFEGFAIAPQADGDTLLTGPFVDQAALHGLLRRVRDLGIPLVSINCVQPGPADTSGDSE
jgi:hypothetical protein